MVPRFHAPVVLKFLGNGGDGGKKSEQAELRGPGGGGGQ